MPAPLTEDRVLIVDWQGFRDGDGRQKSASRERPRLALQRQAPDGTWQVMDWAYPRDESQRTELVLDNLGDGWDRDATVRLVASSCEQDKYHRVDAVALAALHGETPAANRLPLLVAQTTEGEDVRLQALHADSDAFLLGPGEEVELRFAAPYSLSVDRKRTFIFMSKGIYVPMPMIILATAE